MLLYLLMPTCIVDYLLLYKVGTNQISVTVSEQKVWITLIDEGNPQEQFVALEKADWDELKNYIESKLTSDLKIP